MNVAALVITEFSDFLLLVHLTTFSELHKLERSLKTRSLMTWKEVAVVDVKYPRIFLNRPGTREC
jgi:hypothetical protein